MSTQTTATANTKKSREITEERLEAYANRILKEVAYYEEVNRERYSLCI